LELIGDIDGNRRIKANHQTQPCTVYDAIH
jgi:hypothetical protein